MTDDTVLAARDALAAHGPPRRARRRRVIGATYFIVALVLAGAGIVGAWLMVPKEREIALMQLKDEEFRRARQSYEDRLEAGDASVSVVMPLIQIYLYEGQTDRALDLMERFIAQNPDSVEARRRIGEYYTGVQHTGDYRRNLEELTRLEPSEAILRELAAVYRFDGHSLKLEETLEQLSELGAASEAELHELARLEAAYGRLEAAARTLYRLRERHPNAYTANDASLLAAILVDLGRTDEGVKAASDFLAEGPDPEAAVVLASVLDSRGLGEQAYALLLPLAELAEKHADLLAALVSLEAGTGRVEQAFARLRPLWERDALDGELLITFADLALRSDRDQLAFEASRRLDPRALPSWLLLGLTEAAAAGGDTAYLDWLVAAVGEQFLAGRPVLAARIALLRGDGAGAGRWMAQAEADPDLALDQRVALALLYQETGRGDAAIALLRRIAEVPEAPDGVMTDLAQLYLRTGRSEEGAAFFTALRERRRSPGVDAAWALMEAATKGEETVLAWLDAASDAVLTDTLLTDIYFVALDNGAPRLALAAAETLYARRAEPQRRLNLARALTAAGRPGGALEHLRAMLPGDPAVKEAYLAGLTAALKQGLPVREELVGWLDRQLADPMLGEAEREALVAGLVEVGAWDAALPLLRRLAEGEAGGQWFWTYVDAARRAGRKDELVAFLTAALDRPGLSRADAEERLYALLDAGGPAPALPYLRRFAENWAGPWVFAYEEALQKLGREEELVAWLEEAAQLPGLSPEERRNIAFRLLEGGRKQAAERVFLRLAGAEPADGASVRQLLYLWGPRPMPEQRAWIEARALQEEGAARGGWLQHMVDTGAAGRAVELAEAAGAGASVFAGPLFDAYVSGLAALRRRTELAGALDRMIATDPDLPALQGAGRLAVQNGLAQQAYAAFSAVLEELPDDEEALREAGLAAYVIQRYSGARQFLGKYLGSREGTYETNLYYGDTLAFLGNPDAAALYFARALRQIEAASDPSFAMRVARANILHRLGETGKAIAAFEEVRRERPSDPGSRADYGAMLLENRLYQEAQRVLFGS